MALSIVQYTMMIELADFKSPPSMESQQDFFTIITVFTIFG